MKESMKKQAVMELWRLCFDDTEEFIRFYFEKKYREENALVFWDEQGAAIAALQMPPYPMTFAGRQIVAGYISGACTHPLARARGVMTKLLRETFYVMRERKIPVSILIPASEWLYGYYGKMGYATVFDFTPEHYRILEKPASDHFRVEAIRDEALLTDEVFDYFQKMMWQRPCCVQHDREDFETIVEDLRISEGALIVVYGGERVVGMAFAEPWGNRVLVKEGLYDSDDVKRAALWGVMNHLDAAEIYCRALPAGKEDEHRGMARILDVEQVLRLYAVNYPDRSFVLKVTDEWIPENTGIYVVGQGDCSRDEGKRVEAELTIQELTRLLFGYQPERNPVLNPYFETCQPFISLMLD
ncbi:enhanced intracellular survival protein Eis [Odoribacter sp. AF15-53]|uniref:GNAT family N-acetyltransferase n=1 Tax=Odoribacter sp. AF15-53 TaxID=2292236 RepID=UPI000E4EE1E9|nr:GNAT family N-acetyltransferase [Odoribacter sp. AF15-53]RHR77242.1 GNAT family N-acetyltransferase [Odoribacter sp. AF15-53]